MWIILVILISITTFLLYAFYYFYTSLKPPRTLTPYHPSDYGMPCESITLQTEDGIPLKGWFIPPPKTKKAVVVCHGYPMDKGNVLGLAKFLYPEYHLLFFDFRAMGESGGHWTTLGYHETKDLKAALDFLTARGIHEIGVLGLSMGGSVALMMSQDPRIKAIIADSPFSSMDKLLDEMHQRLAFMKGVFNSVLKKLAKGLLKIDLSRISPEKVVKETQIPILMIHGDQDQQIHISHAHALKAANPYIELWIVPDCDHAQAHDLYLEEYETKVKTFLKKHLSQ